MRAIPGLQRAVTVIVDFDIGRGQLIEGITETCFRMRLHLFRKIAWIEQHELDGLRPYGTHSRDELTQATAGTYLQRAACSTRQLLQMTQKFTAE